MYSTPVSSSHTRFGNTVPTCGALALSRTRVIGRNRGLYVVAASKQDGNDFSGKYRDEIKNLVKKLQNRRIDQVQEIQATQTKIFDDFKDFHVATLKIFQDEIQDRIDKIENKIDKNNSETALEVIDGIELTDDDKSRSDSG